MSRYSRISIAFLLPVVLLSACSRKPDHARYIPKDAVAVAGINLKALGKKIAWNMITGSKLFKEMQSRIPEKRTKDAMEGIEKAGIDLVNTFYVYVKPDTRFKGGNRITGLVPLSNSAQWEDYVKRVFPQVEIKQNGGHKEASLGSDMFVGWNSDLLIIINVMSAPTDYNDLMEGRGAQSADRPMEDMASLSAEMNVAFGITKENSILENPRFSSLEGEGHDITFWLNYGQVMSQYGSNMSEMMGGVSLSGALWKDATFTAGFDFKKGKIAGDMRYYLPTEMKEIGAELGGTNIDKDMLSRLPGQNMDVLLAMHISPKGIKDMLEKMGMLGLANTGLAQQNMNADDIFDAFTGDMSFVMNDFSLHTETVTDSFMGQAVTHQNQKPTLSMSYVMKLNKKEKFQKLLALAKQNGLQPMGSGYVIPIDEKDSVYLVANDQYLVVSNKNNYASGIIAGNFTSQKMPSAASDITGHPWAMYMDMQEILKHVDASISHSAHDSAMIIESKKLLNNISFNGGEFKGGAFEYHLDINFTNKDENSIIELLDYGMKMNEADKITQ